MCKASVNLVMELRTLGGLELPGSALRRPKLLLLLTYLSLEGEQPRHRVATLFWPESADRLVNLRMALHHLRRVVPKSCDSSGTHLRTGLEVDVCRLRAAAGRDTLDELRQLYGGPFLQGLSGSWGEELEEWVYSVREAVAGEVRSAYQRAAQRAALAGTWHAAGEWAADALRVPGARPPGPEELSVLYPYLAQAQHPVAGDVRMLAGEFGLALSPQFHALPEHEAPDTADWPVPLHAGPPARHPQGLHQAQAALLPTATPSLANHQVDAGSDLLGDASLPMPTMLTSFVGRETELTELVRRFAQPDLRLLTLTGPGGVGKTRLALEAARALEEEYAGSTGFVALEALPPGADLARTLADRLGADPTGRKDPADAVVVRIGKQRTLLVLDNFEHLLEAAAVVSELLQRCPNLRMIATSRERLGVEAEWVWPVSGLAYANGSDTLPAALATGAVQLFVERARRVNPHFTLREEDLPALISICRLVDGSPLGLELAGGWVRLLSLQDIAHEIGMNLDFLGSATRGKVGRHHSLRAAFEYSWRLLTPDQQQAFRKLAVFRGGFQIGAARRVTGVTLPVLLALVDKSLLRRYPGGRFDYHALIAQYASELLDEHPEERRLIEARHGRTYLMLLTELGGAFGGPQNEAALRRLDEEFENVRAAWEWGVKHASTGELRQAGADAMPYFERRRRYQEGLAFYSLAAQALRADEPTHRAAMSEMLMRQAWFHVTLGQPPEAREAAQRALTLTPPGDSEDELAQRFLGSSARYKGDYPAAVRHFEAALALNRRHGSEVRRASLLSHLSNLQVMLGHLHEAEQTFKEQQQLLPFLSQPEGTITLLIGQGHLFLTTGRLDEAGAVLARGLALAREGNVQEVVPDLLRTLSAVAYEQGNLEESGRLGEEALVLARAHDSVSLQTAALHAIGRARTALEQAEEAQSYLADGLRLAWSIREIPQIMEGLTYLAEGWVKRGGFRQAAPLLNLVRQHPGAHHRLRTLANRLLDEVQAGLSPEFLAEAEEQGVSERVEVLVLEALTSLGSPLPPGQFQ